MNNRITGKGYRTVRIEMNGPDANVATRILETPFWVHPVSGQVYRGEEGAVSHSFNSPSWRAVAALSEKAEYVGNYHQPEQLK